MKDIYRNYLFTKGILVSDGAPEPREAFETLFSLARYFAIRVTDGAVLARREHISYCQKMLGISVPEPFYRHFPDSVRQLSSDQLLFDQVLHYVRTYGLGDFSEPGHSVLEESIERDAFREDVEPKEFIIIDGKAAAEKLRETASSLMDSSRPLSDSQYQLVLSLIREGLFKPGSIASKNTAVMLMNDTRDLSYARYMSLSDVIRAVTDLNYREYGSEDIRKLNLKNRDRRYVASLIDELIRSGRIDTEDCFEKRDRWAGLLHHIHYRAFDEAGEKFVNAIRGGENVSVYSAFEKAMAQGDIRKACDILRERKGPGEVLRKLDYMVSRSADPSDTDYILECADTSNLLILIQLMVRYGIRYPLRRRVFAFTRFGQSTVHQETEDEMNARKSVLSLGQQQYLSERITRRFRDAIGGRLGRVYIDPAMKDVGLPLAQASQQGGYGVMNTSSRIHLPEGKKIRAFTYWEKVNDIDLSVIGLTENGDQVEFSWRTMADNQSDAVTYSGDQTSGYKGGSEYYDIDPDSVRIRYPSLRYMVFCDNVYSQMNFSECVCTAGYMLRDRRDSGEVFEPRTVKSSFAINCESTFAYLFALDLERMDFVWLNMARSGSEHVAGRSSLFYLVRYINTTDIINMHSFFADAATEICDSPQDAEVIVSDSVPASRPGQIIVRSTDSEKVMALMSGKKLF